LPLLPAFRLHTGDTIYIRRLPLDGDDLCSADFRRPHRVRPEARRATTLYLLCTTFDVRADELSNLLVAARSIEAAQQSVGNL
jgi:hypothetical protein